MKTDIKDYVKIYNNFMTQEECKEVINLLEENELWQKHNYHSDRENEFVNFKNELSVCNLPFNPKNQEIQDRLWHFINTYITVDLQENFNLPRCDDLDYQESIRNLENSEYWFNSWAGYSAIRYNKYSVDENMKLHCDHIKTLFSNPAFSGIPILSVVGLLNENFDGGEFELFGDEIINIPTGSVIIFPSNFLFPHRVYPVKSGTRYSFVSWVW